MSTVWRRGADLNRRDPSFRTCFRAFTSISFLRRETLAGKTRFTEGRRPQGRPDRRGRFQGLAVARETSNVCVHPEKERERMKCSLSDIESLSAQIENLGNLGAEQLDQAWRDLFGSGRPRRLCG